MINVCYYIEEHRSRLLDELFDLIRIPSVSSDKNNKEAMYSACGYIKENLLKSGADLAEVMPTNGWPVVYGEKLLNKDLPTILVYGHYDVQPPDPLEEWKSEPFEPEVRNDKIYGRGADDNKGQLFMQLKAFEYMVAEDMLPCNVKFLIEGEEEIGSASLKDFCRNNLQLLAADVILVSDTAMLSFENPTITIGLRGLAYFEITVKGPKRDLHSGLYGGAVKNPVNVLSEIIAGLIDEKGKICIPGFYNSVKIISNEERELLNQVPLDENGLKKSIGVHDLFGEDGYSTIDRLGLRPSLDVNGIWGGYTSEGAKTILPSKASAKISMRLVPDQTPEEIEKLFTEYLQSIKIPGISISVETLHGGNPFVVPWGSMETKAAVAAVNETFGKEALPIRGGGSIPVISTFEEILGIKAVLLGFGLETDAIHSPNENFPLENFFKGIETIPWFYHYFTNYHKK